MLTEYPYTAMKATSSLHCIISLGIIAANAHAHYKIKNSLTSLLTMIIPGVSTVWDILFYPQIAIGVYIFLVASAGSFAGSKSSNKFLVHNCKFLYMTLNCLSIFLFSWAGGISAYIMLQPLLVVDLFNISLHIKATLGLMIAELIMAIISILIICISGNPGSKEDLPSNIHTTIPTVSIQQDMSGYKPPNVQMQIPRSSNQWNPNKPGMW